MSDTESIHPKTTLGVAHLTVSDLGRSTSFYQDNIGLKLLRTDESSASLGTSQTRLLFLTEKPGARLAQGVTGLYHFALLLPSRYELARTLQHLVESRTRLGGFADHAVSEAIYLSDPDGHGIEIYRDRPRTEWEYKEGRLVITTEPFDMDGVMGELGDTGTTWKGIHPQTVMGHMHLHVADIEASRRFYVDVLGFDLVARYGASAIFVSAGGYHHHIGLNTWAGIGAPPPPADALRLQYFELRLPDDRALARVADRIQTADPAVAVREENTSANGFCVRDPAGNQVLLTV
jgi:catechol 2,3-dioxygenase